MKKLSKVLIVILALMMVLSMFAGCQKDENEKNNKNTSNVNDNNDKEEKDEVDNNKDKNDDKNENKNEEKNNEPKEATKLIWWMIGGEPTDQAMVYEKMNEYTKETYNVELETRISGWGEYTEKLNTIISSGENYDICFTCSWANNFNVQAARGAFADITDMLPEYGQGLLDLIPDEIWDVAKREGRIYGIPTYKDSAMGNYYVFSKEYVDKYDLDISGLSKLEDLEPLLKKVKDAEPEVYPFPIDKNGLNGIFPQYENMVTNDVPLVVDIESGTDDVKILYEIEDVMNTLRTLHDYYEAGYINQDAATSESQPKFKVVFGAQGFPYADLEWTNGGGYQTTSVLRHTPYFTTASAQGSMNAISANSKNKEDAVKFLNAVNTDWTLRNMIGYGLEGVHYEKTGDTTIKVLNQGYTPPLFAQATFFTLYTTDPAPVDKWEALKEYVDGAKPSPIMGFIFNPEPVETEIAVVQNVYKKYSSLLHTGSADPDEIVDDMLKELKKAGLEDIQDEVTSQIADWKASK